MALFKLLNFFTVKFSKRIDCQLIWYKMIFLPWFAFFQLLWRLNISVLFLATYISAPVLSLFTLFKSIFYSVFFIINLWCLEIFFILVICQLILLQIYSSFDNLSFSVLEGVLIDDLKHLKFLPKFSIINILLF